MLGYQWFQITGMVLIPLFLATAISSPLFRRPGLMKHHIRLGKLAIALGAVHVLFALSALFLGLFP